MIGAGMWDLSCGSYSSHLLFYLVPMMTTGTYLAHEMLVHGSKATDPKLSFDFISGLLEPSSLYMIK